MSGNPFPASSRYYGVTVAQRVDPATGRTQSYLARRFVPAASQFVTIARHTVIEGERLDRITYQYLGDPLQFWRIADASGVLRPDELEEPGRVALISLPQGLSGVFNA